jgi:hypothetical protein
MPAVHSERSSSWLNSQQLKIAIAPFAPALLIRQVMRRMLIYKAEARVSIRNQAEARGRYGDRAYAQAQ